MPDTSARNEPVYPPGSTDIGRRRKELVPDIHDTFEKFGRAVFSPGALPEKTKQLIDVAHTTQCSYCIAGHTQLARRNGASDEEIMKAIWTAAEMRAGGAYAHSTVALRALGHAQAWRGPPIGTSGRGRCLLVPATRMSA